MAHQDDRELPALLEALLGPEHPGLPFASGVVRHLARSATGEDATARLVVDVVALLRAATDAPDPEGSRALARNPELLASVFQNADLLDAAAPEAAGIARIVMEALEILGEEGG